MAGTAHLKRQDLVYPELSYQIIGIVFDVYNAIGPGHQERIYQRAIAARFRHIGVPFVEQLKVKMIFHGEQIGYYVLDFLVDKKIVLELKRESRFLKKDIDQIYSYLKAAKLQLGIIANFTRSSGVLYKRILNIN